MPERNKTRKANPNQIALAGEFRGWLKQVNRDPTSGNPTPPEYEGVCTLEGNSYWMSGWVNRRGPKPTLDIVFQLAVKGSTPYRFKPEDLRLRSEGRKKPTQEDLDWTHYTQTTPEHRELGQCERCARVKAYLDERFGADAPY